MTDSEKNIKAMVEAEEIKVYTKEDFRKWGRKGKLKDLRLTTPEERSKRAFKAWQTKRQKLSTD